MAKTTAALRGPKLIKKAIDAGRAEALSEPEPVASSMLKKLTLPNGEAISPAMKELLKVDSMWLGLEFDDEEGDIESVSLEDLVEDEFGEGSAAQFAEALDLLTGDCIPLAGASDGLRFLYVGEPDSTGEYPVITVKKDPAPKVSGFVPFDVWVAEELGALESGAALAQYREAVEELAAANGDGRVEFAPEAGVREESDEDEDEEDEDEREEDEDLDAEAAGEDADEDTEQDDADSDEDLEQDDEDLEDDDEEVEDDEDLEDEGELDDEEGEDDEDEDDEEEEGEDDED